jgi:hypothetical protein
LGGLSPSACSRRGLLGAAVAYLAAGTVVRAINAILIQAIIDNRMNKEPTGEDES